jgi:hypothetical protein
VERIVCSVELKNFDNVCMTQVSQGARLFLKGSFEVGALSKRGRKQLQRKHAPNVFVFDKVRFRRAPQAKLRNDKKALSYTLNDVTALPRKCVLSLAHFHSFLCVWFMAAVF